MIHRTEIPFIAMVTYAQPGDPVCDRVIRLDGHIYQCARKPHDSGIHDAGCSHPGDGYLVRW